MMKGTCCDIGHGMTESQITRLRELFLQQGIHLDEEKWVAHISKPGTKENCPFRFTLGPEVDFCASECHLQKVAAQNAEKRSQ